MARKARQSFSRRALPIRARRRRWRGWGPWRSTTRRRVVLLPASSRRSWAPAGHGRDEWESQAPSAGSRAGGSSPTWTGVGSRGQTRSPTPSTPPPGGCSPFLRATACGGGVKIRGTPCRLSPRPTTGTQWRGHSCRRCLSDPGRSGKPHRRRFPRCGWKAFSMMMMRLILDTSQRGQWTQDSPSSEASRRLTLPLLDLEAKP
mmetsp:Transcript_1856/g.4673  ORF Transcript_1856/g.4673 Transcript_1856/m.4673 type:complete len:203 (-) Transcript_1856:739-1347(-)